MHVEAGGSESLGCLGHLSRPHPRRDRRESGKVVDLAEEAVVANERLEHHGVEPHPLLLVRVQVDGQRVIVERPCDNRRCKAHTARSKRFYGRQLHNAPTRSSHGPAE